MQQAEARAEFAERSVQKLQKEVDRLEGMVFMNFFTNFYASLSTRVQIFICLLNSKIFLSKIIISILLSIKKNNHL